MEGAGAQAKQRTGAGAVSADDFDEQLELARLYAELDPTEQEGWRSRPVRDPATILDEMEKEQYLDFEELYPRTLMDEQKPTPDQAELAKDVLAGQRQNTSSVPTGSKMQLLN